MRGIASRCVALTLQCDRCEACEVFAFYRKLCEEIKIGFQLFSIYVCIICTDIYQIYQFFFAEATGLYFSWPLSAGLRWDESWTTAWRRYQSGAEANFDSVAQAEGNGLASLSIKVQLGF